MQIYRASNLINGKWYIGKDENSRNYYLGSRGNTYQGGKKK